MKRFFKILLVLGISYGLFYGLFLSSYFSIEEISFSGTSISEEELLRYSRVSTGDNLIILNEAYTKNGLLRHPKIRQVTLTKNYPKGLQIDLVERKPFAYFSYLDRILAVDEYGVVVEAMEPREVSYFIQGLEIDGFVAGQELSTHHDAYVKGILDLVAYLKADQLPEDFRIKYEGRAIYVYMNDRYYANFGTPDDLLEKYQIFYTLYEDFKADNISSGYINISYLEMPSFSFLEEE